MRPEEQTRTAVIVRQLEAVSRGLAQLEEHPPAAAHADIGSVSVVCALGYLDFRFSDLDWRAGHPRLARWFATFTAALPGFAATVPPG